MDNFFQEPYNIEAILPQYTDRGDLTIILYADGKTTTEAVRVRTAIRRLARSLAVDLAALKQRTSQTTYGSIQQPLPLAPGLTLFPVKVRTPRVAGDYCMAYFNLHSIAKIGASTAHPRQAVILLNSGREVPVLWTQATVQRHMQHARLAAGYTPHAGHAFLQESLQIYGPQAALIRRLTELFCEILLLKTGSANH